MKYIVEYTGDYGYGSELFREEFDGFEEAKKRYEEIGSEYLPPMYLKLTDTITEAKAEIAKAEAEIAKLKEKIAKLEIVVKMG